MHCYCCSEATRLHYMLSLWGVIDLLSALPIVFSFKIITTFEHVFRVAVVKFTLKSDPRASPTPVPYLPPIPTSKRQG